MARRVAISVRLPPPRNVQRLVRLAGLIGCPRVRRRGDVLGQLLLLRCVLELVGGERLDVGDDVPPVLLWKNRPRGHGGSRHAVADDAVEVLVTGRLARRRADLVDPAGEVARLGIEQLGRRALAVPLLAVAQETLALVDGLARVGVARLPPREGRPKTESENGSSERDRAESSIDTQRGGSGGHFVAPRFHQAPRFPNARHSPSPSVAAAGRSRRTGT